MTGFPVDPWISPNHITAPCGPTKVSNLTWTRDGVGQSDNCSVYEDLAVTCTSVYYIFSAQCMLVLITPPIIRHGGRPDSQFPLLLWAE